MAKKKVHVEVGRQTLELSNLDKVLYPDEGIVKAQVIELTSDEEAWLSINHRWFKHQLLPATAVIGTQQLRV